MTREIKFRGRSIHTDKWHYGDLFRPNENTSFIYEKGTAGVLCSHIGQFTGLLDKNGKEIYEGDIIEIKEIGGYGSNRKGVVEYDVDECAFIVRVLRPSWPDTVRLSTKVQICADMNCTHEYINQYTVIGNIHDMEGGAE